MSYRVVIPTAGIGSRLGDLTKYINKSLVSISHRPTLCHSLEQFPPDSEFVIALGHKGNLVREFIEIVYPSRTFYFADVNPYVGNGSGLGHSLLCCERYLQEPFIFLSCDTLVKENIPFPDYDWVGCADAENISSYRTVSINKNLVDGIYEKGSTDVYNPYAYIGLAGINNYAEFWTAMHQGGNIAVDQGEAYGLRSLLDKNQLKAHYFTWFDTGTPSALERTRLQYSQPNEPNILEKQNEAIWFVGNRVVKFSDDKTFISNRIKRSFSLSDFVPRVENSSDHLYTYKKVEGKVVTEVVTLSLFKNLLNTCNDFWKLAKLNDIQTLEFKNKCQAFYYDKTIKRVDLFYNNFCKKDGSELINDEPMPLLSSLLERIDWENITTGLPGRFHGDFHFENIIWNSDSDSFTFLDWRQDFGGDLHYGDIYYDLAKLLHGLIISHDLIAANAFTIEWNIDEIKFNFSRHQSHVECEKYFAIWCNENNFDFSKVRTLTALIYLNIAALHHHPYSLLLYSLGKRMLKTELDQQFAVIPRDRDVIFGNEDLESLYEFKKFPVYMGCVNQDISQDLLANMHWTISKKSGVIQLNPLLPLEIVYPESHGSGCIGKLWMQHHSSFANFIKRYSPKSILEIGGAHGILSELYHFQDSQTSWTIVEPNPTPGENVKARFIKGFFDDQFKLSEHVDIVVHSHVLEHIYYPQRFMQHISSFLENGKHLIFSLPNMKEMLKRKYNNCLNFEHTIFLTEPYIEYLLSQNGFRLLEREYFMDDHSIFYACIRDKSIIANESQLTSKLYDYNKKLYLDYVVHHVDLIEDLNNHLSRLRPSQKVYLFGAHVFAQYLLGFGLETSRIEGLLDNDSNKQGKRLYGSNLHVSSPKVLANYEDPVVILKAGVYNEEIKKDILDNINRSTIFLE